ncbi:MAG: chorismate mutase [Bacteroidota bacterium]
MKNKLPWECTSIDEVRTEIDELDQEILKLLGERFQYVKEIVRFKTDKDSVIARERYNWVIQERKKWGEKNGLNGEVIEEMYKLLINHFIEEEIKILKNIKK